MSMVGCGVIRAKASGRLVTTTLVAAPGDWLQSSQRDIKSPSLQIIRAYPHPELNIEQVADQHVNGGRKPIEVLSERNPTAIAGFAAPLLRPVPFGQPAVSELIG